MGGWACWPPNPLVSTLRYGRILRSLGRRAFFYKRSLDFMDEERYAEDVRRHEDVGKTFGFDPDPNVRALLFELEEQIKECPGAKLMRYPCEWLGWKEDKVRDWFRCQSSVGCCVVCCSHVLLIPCDPFARVRVCS